MNIVGWNEYRHEKSNEAVAAIYPEGIHSVIAQGLQQEGVNVKTATLDEVEHGLTDKVLSETDVLVWWGHKAHDHHPQIKKVIANAARWAAPMDGPQLQFGKSEPLEKL
ncbi:hypothetical protein ASD40_28745 [Paenibacillus sp. Root444D2]|nr:hypothetical protein ASD40_28745 [Paenibacillus sp. Root444D2]KRE43169.1 hypothetical protein ASG85_33325 [Paenibacillus sp. Soil724D2]